MPACVQVLSQRVGDEASQEPILAQALYPNAAPQVTRDTGIQVHEVLFLEHFKRPLLSRGRTHEISPSTPCLGWLRGSRHIYTSPFTPASPLRYEKQCTPRWRNWQ